MSEEENNPNFNSEPDESTEIPEIPDEDLGYEERDLNTGDVIKK